MSDRKDIIFLKNVKLVNALLKTGKCKNEGRWIITCEDNEEDMRILQKAYTHALKGTIYRNHKLIFSDRGDYSNLKIIDND